MKHGLVIRGGTIIDGSGGPAMHGDVAIPDDRIVAIGNDLGAAVRTIDASGLVVTPGFIDIHTHLDAELGVVDEIRSRLTALPERAQRKVLGENVMRFYGLDRT